KAILALRNRGYRIGLPDTGNVDVPESETKRLADDIARIASSLGSTLATSAAGGMASSYSALTGRFSLGRDGRTVQLNAQPQLPLAYLYQLGLRYFVQKPTADNLHSALAELSSLVTSATALLDLSIGTFELIYARPTDIIRIMQKSIVYDSVFYVTQVKPAHAREYINWMLSHKPLADLKDVKGRTTHQVLSVALMLLRACERE